VAFTYNGSTSAPVNVGTYDVVATYDGDTNYDPASRTGTLTVTKATPTMNLGDAAFTYDAAPHGAAASVTGAGGANLGPITFTYNGSPDTPVNAGSYSVVASY